MSASSADKSLRISIELALSQVHWKLVGSILVSHFDLEQQAAEKLTAAFRRRLAGPLSLYWFRASRLCRDDEKVLAALCEAHGADTLSLYSGQRFSIWRLSCAYRQQITFHHASGRQAAGSSAQIVPEVTVELGGWQFRLQRLRSVLLMQILLVLSGALFYAVAAACLLYGVAVVLLFFVEPAYVTLAATRRLPLGLALVCMLAGLAGICGRAFRNVLGLVWQRLSRGLRR